MSKDFNIHKALKNNAITRTAKKHPVAVGVGTTYCVGSTIAYTAAGASFGTALAYSVGVTAVYGAICYGAIHMVKRMAEVQQTEKI